MNKRDELRLLETELAEFYLPFRGVAAPKTFVSEALWGRIEALIAEVER